MRIGDWIDGLFDGDKKGLRVMGSLWTGLALLIAVSAYCEHEPALRLAAPGEETLFQQILRETDCAASAGQSVWTESGSLAKQIAREGESGGQKNASPRLPEGDC